MDRLSKLFAAFRCRGLSWEDAKNQVVAAVEGIDASALTSELVSVRPVQQRTQAISTWLANHAEATDGRLNFNNGDLARAAGWPRPNQALGNLLSRLDLCCAKAGLPAIGCTAHKTFKDAWQRPGEQRVQFDWDFPVEQMQRRAKAHRWTRADFQRIGRESRALRLPGSLPCVGRNDGQARGSDQGVEPCHDLNLAAPSGRAQAERSGPAL